MGLFYNNDVAGRGVEKGVKKKPFFRFWELFGGKFWTFFTLNLIYVLFCLPIVTIGPATAALTAMMRNIYLERPQFIWHDFVDYFKKNFKQSFIIGILDIAAVAVMVITFIENAKNASPDTTSKILYALSIAAQVMFLMLNFYIYPQIVALNLRMSGILKNAVILMFINLPAELIVLVTIMGFSALFLYFTFPLVFLLPILPGAWLVYLSVFCCYPAIQKHIINPYYEQIGERNPEIPDWEYGDDEAVFEDQGGREEPLRMKKEKGRKRTIK